jgi:hypothetical protein
MNTNRLLNRKEASSYLHDLGAPVAVATLAKYATIGGGPTISYFGRFPRYKINDLDAWIASKLSAPRRSRSRRFASDHGGHADAA